ncbi:hypothetical protein [Paludisphaera rhizosphaerae]|uniref:hypothetical protein n=1 Tax=Paludisphaera rhizosphaerae TaxID=2711216 RepID=UPI0013EBF6DA|nr:hypothetical protein [Paludisphaera rhizosphaerae]
MKRHQIALIGMLAVTLASAVAGCSGDSLPPPPSTGDTKDAWPDEVKQAEAKFAEKAAAKAAGRKH